MKKTTVYSFARYLMNDEEFNRGGWPEKGDYYINAIGLTAEDEEEFFKAMWTICCMNKKYKKEA